MFVAALTATLNELLKRAALPVPSFVPEMLGSPAKLVKAYGVQNDGVHNDCAPACNAVAIRAKKTSHVFIKVPVRRRICIRKGSLCRALSDAGPIQDQGAQFTTNSWLKIPIS